MIILIAQERKMRVSFTWDAEWTVAGGTNVKDGWRITLIFEPETNKLISIDGKNPFLAHPGETPGEAIVNRKKCRSSIWGSFECKN